ncbi:MAG: hypothetical protein D6722_13490 [Bacteroidetes bacterium]|nr:MAG: hypothetical protein D6722_13490 [Bacteroidota bacterium]
MIRFSLLFLLAFLACQSNIAQNAPEPLVLQEDPASGQYGYADATGKVQIAAGKYAYCMTDTFRTHAIVRLRTQPKWVVIDRQERVLYEVFPYDNGPDYPSEGLFRIMVDGKIGYADGETFEIVIQPQFGCAYPFEGGQARVSYDCQSVQDGEYTSWESASWQYVDRQGVVK